MTPQKENDAMSTLTWEDTRKVVMDENMQFGHGYDFDGLNHMRSEADTPIGRFMVWPDYISGGSWNLYGGKEGWYQRGFENEKSAMEEVERFSNDP